MTAYIKTVSESHTTADIVTQTTPSVHRTVVEPGSTSDNPQRRFQSRRSTSETLSSSQTVTRSAGHPRGLTEAYSASDTSSRHYHANRLGIIDFATSLNDPIPNPFLYPNPNLYPGAINDQVTVQHSAPRFIVETLPSIHDVSTRTVQSRRLPVESLSVSDVIQCAFVANRLIVQTLPAATDQMISQAGRPRSLTETLTTVDSVVRSHGLSRFISESYSASDSFSESSHHPRFIVETLHTFDQIVRHTHAHRSPIETLHLVETLSAFGSHPRLVIEHLTPAYNTVTLSFRAPTLGQLWFDPTTNQVVAQLPDWAFVLIENPTTGNGLWYQPINPWIYNPTRTK